MFDFDFILFYTKVAGTACESHRSLGPIFHCHPFSIIYLWKINLKYIYFLLELRLLFLSFNRV